MNFTGILKTLTTVWNFVKKSDDLLCWLLGLEIPNKYKFLYKSLVDVANFALDAANEFADKVKATPEKYDDKILYGVLDYIESVGITLIEGVKEIKQKLK